MIRDKSLKSDACKKDQDDANIQPHPVGRNDNDAFGLRPPPAAGRKPGRGAAPAVETKTRRWGRRRLQA